MPIWDEAYLNTLIADGEDAVVNEVDCIFDRISLAVTTGKSVYTLPDCVTRLIRVTWKGKKLHPLSFQDFCALNPASAVVNESDKIESPTGIPFYYVKHPTNHRDIRFWPTPNEDIAQGTTDLFGANIASCVIFSVYRTLSDSLAYGHLPLYLKRRIMKAYVLSRAFAKEGKGQNLIAAQYYKQKYNALIKGLRDINSNVYLGKVRVLSENIYDLGYGTPARPVLPSNFGSIV